MIEIIGWITGIATGVLVGLYLLFRYFVWPIRNNAIARHGLSKLEQKVLLCAEREYRIASGGMRLPPGETDSTARAIKTIPDDIKEKIVSGRMSYLASLDQMMDSST